MLDKEIKTYKLLNELAETGEIVIFGGSDDKNIPLCELKEAFFPDTRLCNRSIAKLSVSDAEKIYAECVAEICPKTVLLHIGTADLPHFSDNQSVFEREYISLIRHIKADNKKCEVAVVSLKNYENKAEITKLNKSLKNIADSEHCDYCDISSRRVWNPKQTKDVVSFIYDMGFVSPSKNKRPINDLVKILFCYE